MMRGASASTAVACIGSFVVSGLELAANSPFSWLTISGALQWVIMPWALLLGALAGLMARGATNGALRQMGITTGLAILVLPFFLSGLVLFAALFAVAIVASIAARKGHSLSNPRALARFLGIGLVMSLSAGVLGFLFPGASATSQSYPPALARGEVDDRPNVVVVVCDTLRAGSMSVYGYERDTTPFLEDLASRGILWSQAEATGNHTPPSHASLFTGLYPSEHGVMATGVGLPQGPETLAERLSGRGYATVGVTTNFVIRSAAGFGRGFDVFDDSLLRQTPLSPSIEFMRRSTYHGRSLGDVPFLLSRITLNKLLANAAMDRRAVHADEVNQLAMQHMQAVQSTGRPLFMFLNYMQAHAPYQAPGAWFDKYLEHDPGPFRERLSKLAFSKLHGDLLREVRAGQDHHEVVGALQDRYDAEIAYLDSQLAELEEIVAEESGDRPWVLIVTSDHGEHFGEHGLLRHGDALFEETQHIPLMAVGTHLPQGLVAPETVSLLDVPGTVLSLAGIAEPLGHSQSLLSEAGTPRKPSSRLVLAELGPLGVLSHFHSLNEVAVYENKHKTMLRVDNEGSAFEVLRAFDLSTDSAESSPLRPSSMADSLLRRQSSWASDWWQTYQAGRNRSSSVQLSAQDLANLEEIGYALASEDD